MRDTTEAAWLEGSGNYDEVYADMKERAQGPPDQDHPRPDPPPAECSCVPCESPGRGHPGIAHCAACCSGSLIEAYDHGCPVPDHRDMAVAQFGPEPDYEKILEDRAADRGPDPEAIMWGGRTS